MLNWGYLFDRWRWTETPAWWCAHENHLHTASLLWLSVQKQGLADDNVLPLCLRGPAQFLELFSARTARNLECTNSLKNYAVRNITQSLDSTWFSPLFTFWGQSHFPQHIKPLATRPLISTNRFGQHDNRICRPPVESYVHENLYRSPVLLFAWIAWRESHICKCATPGNIMDASVEMNHSSFHRQLREHCSIVIWMHFWGVGGFSSRYRIPNTLPSIFAVSLYDSQISYEVIGSR